MATLSDIKLMTRDEAETLVNTAENAATYTFDGWGSKFKLQEFTQTSLTPAGTYYPSEGYIGYGSVTTVEVTHTANVKDITFTVNGTYPPETGYDGYKNVTVAVPNSTETKEITANGTYDPTSPNIGFSQVVVNVPNSTEEITITDNDTYLPTSPNIGFRKVIVSVPTGTEEKTITTNGTYTPESPNIGFSKVTVNVQGYGDLLKSIVDRSVTDISNDNITSVGAYALAKCLALESISLPNCTTINEGAFKETFSSTIQPLVSLPICTSLGVESFAGSNIRTITLPETLTVGTSAFADCSKATTIYIPKCTEIDELAFSSCPTLEAIYLNNVTSVTTIETNSFGSAAHATPINVYVPAALLTDFQADINWGNLVTNGYVTLVAYTE